MLSYSTVIARATVMPTAACLVDADALIWCRWESDRPVYGVYGICWISSGPLHTRSPIIPTPEFLHAVFKPQPPGGLVYASKLDL